MARPRTGEFVRKRTSQGMTYAVRFSYRGERHFVKLGSEWEGWTEERAIAEQGYLMAKVNRGEWTPPEPEPERTRAAAPTFQIEASEWLQRQAIKASDPYRRSKTIRDLEWCLSVVMDVFGPIRIDRLSYRHAEDLVGRLVQERLDIERAREEGAPLVQTCVHPRTGRTYTMRRRGVSNTSIRRALDVAHRVLRDAKRRGAFVRDRPELKDAAPRAERPNRSYLEPEQIVAVLRAAELIEAERRGLTWEKVAQIRASDASALALAGEFGVSDTLIRKVRRGELWADSAAPRNRNDVARRAIVETLILAGPRVSELCGLNVQHVDLASGRLRIPREATKTDAGERIVPMLPILQEHLTDHRLDHPGAPTAPAFPTRNGTAQHPDNIRARILEPIRQRANELLAAEGRLPIAHMTPHTLRRTFASILAACDVPPRRAMYLMGHTDAKFTMSVYQQVLDMGRGSVEALEAVLGCTLAEAREYYVGHGVLPPNSHPGTKTASAAELSPTGEA
jgi:integrase